MSISIQQITSCLLSHEPRSRSNGVTGVVEPWCISTATRKITVVTTAPQTISPPLVSLGRVVLEDAKVMRGRGKRVQHFVLGFGVFAVLVQAVPPLIQAQHTLAWVMPLSKTLAYLCAISGLILQGVRWWCQRSAVDTHALGSTIRRRALLIESLGPSVEQLDIRLLREEAGADAESRARKEPTTDSYFASNKPPGMERLRDNLQESAFFTHRLYAKAARTAFITFGAGVACTVVGLLLVTYLAPREFGSVVANCTLAFVSFLVSADQLGQGMNWRSAAATIERIERRLESITPNGNEPYLAAFADYEAATAASPPVPTALYMRERGRLDALWRDRSGQ